MNEPPDLNKAICVMASAQLFMLHLLRNYLSAIHPKNENLQRVDEMIAELREIHDRCWIKPLD